MPKELLLHIISQFLFQYFKAKKYLSTRFSSQNAHLKNKNKESTSSRPFNSCGGVLVMFEEIEVLARVVTIILLPLPLIPVFLPHINQDQQELSTL